jgi:hypothetical protein
MGNIFNRPDEKEKLRRAAKADVTQNVFDKCPEIMEEQIKYMYDNGVRATSSANCPSGKVQAAEKKGKYMVCRPENFDVTSSNPRIKDFRARLATCTGTSTYVPEPYSGKSFNALQ